MSVIIDGSSRVLIQGVTGREGRPRAKLMIEYGTNVVAGVTPGKGGQSVHGIPVFDSVYQAWTTIGPIDVSIIFVPANVAKSAASEALEAGVKWIVLVADRFPQQDLMELEAVAEPMGGHIIGPNTIGLISPGKALVGMMGGKASTARLWFEEGNVGISSRSGGMATTLAYYLTLRGIGQSTVVSVGGDAIVGISHADLLELFEGDAQTEVVALYGEIGTTQEEAAAELKRSGRFTKPLVAYLGGRGAKPGVRYSHSGAIVHGSRGTIEAKEKALVEVGAQVVDNLESFVDMVEEILRGAKEARARR